MLRYLRLYRYFLLFSFSKSLTFRFDFTFRIFMDLIFYVILFMFFKVIYTQTPYLGGYSESEILLFAASVCFMDAFNMTFFASNAWWFPIFVNNGDFDYYLTRPVSPLFFASLKEFAANSFINLLITSAMMAWALHQLPESSSLLSIVLFFILLINGCILHHVIHMLFLLPVFWTQSPRGFDSLYYAMTRIIEKPDQIFNKKFRMIFTYIMPIMLVVSLPVKTFLRGFGTTDLMTIIAVTVIFWTFFLYAWKISLKHYSSASS